MKALTEKVIVRVSAGMLIVIFTGVVSFATYLVTISSRLEASERKTEKLELLVDRVVEMISPFKTDLAVIKSEVGDIKRAVYSGRGERNGK
jgi:hypothetical protein